MGGEAILPLHYFTKLRSRDVEVWLITHERVRAELTALLGSDIARVSFLRDTRLQETAHRIGTFIPRRVADVTTGFIVGASTGIRMRRLARQLVRKYRITVVHQPSPVSPRIPSHIHDVGAPTIIGPMNGGMTFPPAFRATASPAERIFVRLGRAVSGLANYVVPGKRRAALLLVANERTRAALPNGITSRVVELVENGVDLDVWSRRAPDEANDAPSSNVPLFCYLGFLKDWKAVDIIIEAVAIVVAQREIRVEIIGDGVERDRLELLTRTHGLSESVRFAGFVPQEECPVILQGARALLLPSVFECGGAVVLEAMSLGIPVVATRWGGPADYLNDDCGILIDPTSRKAMVRGFVDAIVELTDDPTRALRLGAAGQRRARELFSWSSKIDTVLELYKWAAVTGQE
jgi:glycosyltransferase involved in cell wall biosynthesis